MDPTLKFFVRGLMVRQAAKEVAKFCKKEDGETFAAYYPNHARRSSFRLGTMHVQCPTVSTGFSQDVLLET